MIRSEIPSSAELKSRFAFVSAPSRQRDTAHGLIGTGRLRARRRFGYWGEQIGYLRGQRGHHFVARRQELEQPRVSIGTAMENIESIGRPAADR
jgi:hypothetical protein